MTHTAKRNVPARRRLFEGGPLATLREEMDEMLENWFGHGEGTAVAPVSNPRFDISETEADVEVQTDVPGFKPDEIDIEVRDDMLTICGEHSEEKKTDEKDKKSKGRTYHRIERSSGSFSRSVWLPCDVDAENVKAVLNDGVLTVTLPKTSEGKTCKIKVLPR